MQSKPETYAKVDAQGRSEIPLVASLTPVTDHGRCGGNRQESAETLPSIELFGIRVVYV